jgi:ribosomal subunit interface protein
LELRNGAHLIQREGRFVRVTITERHCEVPRNVLTRTESQVGSLSKFEQRATHAEVVYHDERRARKVEVVVHVDGAGQVAAKGEGDDFRSALDQVVDRLRRMLREQRERRRDHHAPPLSEGVVGE